MFRDLESKPNPFFERCCDVVFVVGAILAGLAIFLLIAIPWIVILKISFSL